MALARHMALVVPALAFGLTADIAWTREPASYGAPVVEAAPVVKATTGQDTQQSSTITQQSMMEILNRLEQLQRETQQLRGQVEVQTHTIEQMGKQQRQQYLDIDGRIQKLESGGGVRGVTRSVEPAPTPPARPVVPPVEMSAPESEVVSPPQPDTTAIGGVSDRMAYDEAFTLLNDGHYTAAADGFRKFVVDYPDSPYADNAQYWLAETYYKNRQFKTALEEFLVILEKYPNSPKIPDAKLKIGFIYYELQDWSRATQALTEVTKQSPGSTAARLAEQRLESMRLEGH